MLQPVIISDTVAIADGSQALNVIAQNTALIPLQRAPFTGKGKLVASCTGNATTSNKFTIQFQHGDRKVVASSNPRSDANGLIQEPNDVIADDWYVEEGEVLLLLASNAEGASKNLTYRIELQPLVGSGELPPDTLVQQQGYIAVAANATDQQLLANTDWERPPADAIGSLYMTSSTATGSPNRQLYVDMQRIAPPSAIVPQNRIPQIPFDLSIAGFFCPRNKLIQIPASWGATGGGVFWKLLLKRLTR